MKTCLVCKKEVLDDDLKFYLYLDIPKVALILHRECFRACKSRINDILLENVDFIYKVKGEQDNAKQKSNKATKTV